MRKNIAKCSVVGVMNLCGIMSPAHDLIGDHVLFFFFSRREPESELTHSVHLYLVKYNWLKEGKSQMQWSWSFHEFIFPQGYKNNKIEKSTVMVATMITSQTKSGCSLLVTIRANEFLQRRIAPTTTFIPLIWQLYYDTLILQ